MCCMFMRHPFIEYPALRSLAEMHSPHAAGHVVTMIDQSTALAWRDLHKTPGACRAAGRSRSFVIAAAFRTIPGELRIRRIWKVVEHSQIRPADTCCGSLWTVRIRIAKSAGHLEGNFGDDAHLINQVTQFRIVADSCDRSSFSIVRLALFQTPKLV